MNTVRDKDPPFVKIGSIGAKHLHDLMCRIRKYRHRNPHRCRKAQKRIQAWLEEGVE